MGKLLVIADAGNKCSATPRGLEMAAKLGHSTEVIAFTYASLKAPGIAASQRSAIKKRLMAEREEAVRARVDKYSSSGQKVTVKAVWSKDIVDWVVARCQKMKFAAVVKTGNRTDSIIHTSTDWCLLRECPAPVMIVAEKKWSSTKPILAAIDLNSKVEVKHDLNHTVIAAAKRMAEALQAELKIITAVEVPVLLSDLDVIDPKAYAAEAIEAMRPRIRELAAAHDLPEKMFRTKRGPVEKVITSEAAKQRAQLVVMGTVGRKGVKARLLGNTAEQVLRHLKTDVLALKP